MIRDRRRSSWLLTAALWLATAAASATPVAAAEAEAEAEVVPPVDADTPPDPTEPTPMSPAARHHYDEGLRLYAERNYSAAVEQLEAGFALEPRREFLFAEAQAYRLAGDCAHAVPLYERFLDTKPSPIQIDATRLGLDRCAKQAPRAPIASTPPAPTVDGRAVTRTMPVGAPAGPAPEPPRFWHDPWGLVLSGAGVVALGVGIGYVVASNEALDRANSAATDTYPEFDRLLSIAERRRAIGLWTLAGGAVSLAGGIARFALVHHREHAVGATATATATATTNATTNACVTIAPYADGAGLLWQGSF